MKLHEAIVKLLQQNGEPMTITEIAKRLNQNKWYKKKDGSIITTFQISGRTKNYTQLFSKQGSTVTLKKSTGKNKVEAPVIIKPDTSLQKTTVTIDYKEAEKTLMNVKSFKNVPKAELHIPNNSGMYCIRLNTSEAIPKDFNQHLVERNHNIIYIGIATQSLAKRFFNQELRAKGHGTFFRSLGAMLGYSPVPGSLMDKANKRNYKFSKNDEAKIIQWIDEHLLINWISLSGEFEQLETRLILKYKPLLNIAKNPMALQKLSELRAECVRIANRI
jgi:hypothetical protein